MKDLTKTKVYGVDLDAEGKRKVKADGELATYITSETAFNAELKKATEAKTPLPEALAIGTFAYKFAETVDEAVSLCGGNGVGEYENITVFIDVFNYGASLRQENAANALLKADTYVPQDGAIDVSFAVAEKVERAKMSPEEKAAKMIGITPEALRAALALIKGQAQGATAGSLGQ